jgi:hypothetical protein
MNGREGLSDLIDDDFEPQRSFESSILSAISPFFLVFHFEIVDSWPETQSGTTGTSSQPDLGTAGLPSQGGAVIIATRASVF